MDAPNAEERSSDDAATQGRSPGRKEYSVTPQVYHEHSFSRSQHSGRRALLQVSKTPTLQKDSKQPIRIYLNYDVVGHSYDRDCLNVGDLVKLGEPSATSVPRSFVCTPNGDRPVFADCWYNCTLEDISGEDKKQRLKKV
ncbi:hypothetical protein ZIOFF_068263 [Zingiber officinale]|uniref:Uncharacterized protein n=1 Tax=Zingiber officinale TaxID=94328 RepID=A0A8J5C7Z4_ZINOF|nr:hypothetical protein ZIOFF_068263 [Zingiber officinale]